MEEEAKRKREKQRRNAKIAQPKRIELRKLQFAASTAVWLAAAATQSWS